MFYGDTIEETRQMYFTSWQKFKNHLPLSPLEDQVAQIIALHPEYQAIMDNPEQYKQRHYHPELGETNPFLHLGLHLGVRDQLATNKPAGIRQVYEQLLKKLKDEHEVEHVLMNILAEFMWQVQRNNLPPDEEEYFKLLQTALTIS